MKNATVSAPPHPSYYAKGRNGSSKPDLLVDIEKENISQPRSEIWNGTSDHTPILYEVRNTNLKASRKRVSKTMLHNLRNVAEARESTRKHYHSWWKG